MHFFRLALLVIAALLVVYALSVLNGNFATQASDTIGPTEVAEWESFYNANLPSESAKVQAWSVANSVVNAALANAQQTGSTATAGSQSPTGGAAPTTTPAAPSFDLVGYIGNLQNSTSPTINAAAPAQTYTGPQSTAPASAVGGTVPVAAPASTS